MRQVTCAACGTKFYPGTEASALVRFSNESSEIDEQASSAWFCARHVHHARRHAHLPLTQAVGHVRNASKVSTALLVVVPTLLTGLSAAAGAMIGVRLFNFAGLIAGTLASGLLGVLLSGAVSLRAGWIRHDRARSAVAGGAIGLFVSLIVNIAGTATYDSLLIPIASILLVGAGFLRGSRLRPIRPDNDHAASTASNQ